MDVAKHTDLLGLLPSLGYTLKRIGSYYTTAEMDSIRIRDPTRWKRYSTGQGGDAITFLQEFCGMRFPEAVDYLLAYHGRRRRKVRSTPFPPDGENSTRSLAPPLPIGPASLGSDGSPDSPGRDKPVPRPKPPPPREKPPFVLPPANSDQRRVFAYLRKRGIASQVRFPSRSGTIPTSPPPLRAASPPNITTFCMSAIRCPGTMNSAPDRSSRSFNICGKKEKAALTSLRWLLLEWGPHFPTTPLFRNWQDHWQKN